MEFSKNVCISEIFYFGKNMLCFRGKSKLIGSDSKKNLDVYLLNSSQHSVLYYLNEMKLRTITRPKFIEK